MSLLLFFRRLFRSRLSRCLFGLRHCDTLLLPLWAFLLPFMALGSMRIFYKVLETRVKQLFYYPHKSSAENYPCDDGIQDCYFHFFLPIPPYFLCLILYKAYPMPLYKPPKL